MDLLDIKTLLLSQTFTDVVCAVVMAFLWYRSRKRYAGLSLWLADYVLQCAAVFLVILRGRIPGPWSIAPVVPLALAGSWAMLAGLERFVGRRSSQVPNAVLFGLLLLVQLHYTFVRPDMSARTLVMSAGILAYTAQCAWLLLRRTRPGLRSLGRGLGLVFAAYGLVSLARIALILGGGLGTDDLFRSGPLHAALLLAYQILFIAQTTGLILMVSRRLLGEVASQEERYAKAFHSAPYAVILTRLSDGKILQVNDGFASLSGYPTAQVRGRTTTELSLWDRPEDREAVVRALAEGRRVQGREFPFRTRSGEVFTGLFSADIIAVDGEECVLSTIADISGRKQAEREREELIRELQEALGKVKILSGLLPICASCKKIRDDKGEWTHVETYFRRHSEADFTHGICPECTKKLYPDFAGRRTENGGPGGPGDAPEDKG